GAEEDAAVFRYGLDQPAADRLALQAYGAAALGDDEEHGRRGHGAGHGLSPERGLVAVELRQEPAHHRAEEVADAVHAAGHGERAAVELQGHGLADVRQARKLPERPSAAHDEDE